MYSFICLQIIRISTFKESNHILLFTVTSCCLTMQASKTVTQDLFWGAVNFQLYGFGLSTDIYPFEDLNDNLRKASNCKHPVA